METKDKVAMILTRYGYSLEDGLNMYDELMASKDGEVIKIDRVNGCVVWLERGDIGTKLMRTKALTAWCRYMNESPMCSMHSEYWSIRQDSCQPVRGCTHTS